MIRPASRPWGALLAGLLMVAMISKAYASAERVKTVFKDGTLEMASGGHVRFAGIQLAPESFSLLKTLLAGKEVEVEFDSDLARLVSGPAKPGYIYVKAREMEWKPGPPAARDNHVMVNQLLIDMGAARVEENIPFRHKTRFLEAQNSAKTRGEGIWSYEPFD